MLLQCEYKHAAKLLQYVFTTNKYCCSYLLSADTTSSSPPSERLNEGNFLKDQKLSGCNFFSYKQHLKDQSTRAGRIPPSTTGNWVCRKCRMENIGPLERSGKSIGIDKNKRREGGGGIKCHPVSAVFKLQHPECKCYNMKGRIISYLSFIPSLWKNTMNTVLTLSIP